ncbi:hypothetical protein I862_01605 [endosymbiont of Acanthamoeba sp. UWC8]|uniref:hypothetical protein n=1 Tax=endosymbiont of Acanthamoeba sp. UWC8 TaxID=86106 RepID=UPI0004D0BB18|nr:hypothetical protein [endosymbiont of Acanthamoeba sp. UWC8]AIF80884.1 hypothetical protein I862_01605 [endosymbiont of Acanthamoeba sp. UWC8]
MAKPNKKGKIHIDHTAKVAEQVDKNASIIKESIETINKAAINKVEKLIIKDISNHSEQLVNVCIKGIDHATQNSEFSAQIVNNYITNWNLIMDDMWSVCEKYSNDAIASKNFEDIFKVNMNAVESFTNIVRQMSLVNSQTILDCCNEVVVPSIKQTTYSVEKLKKCYNSSNAC